MKTMKKFISPNTWFEFEYPEAWFEFEDGEGAFLFYNPDVWDGNFRISGFKGETPNYGEEFVRDEIDYNLKLKSYDLPGATGAYEVSYFEQDEHEFASHRWYIGLRDMGLVCTFTVLKHSSIALAEQIIKSIKVRDLSEKYPAEIIPVRLSEIYDIDEAYESIAKFVKDTFSKDFQGIEEDVATLSKILDDQLFSAKKRDRWIDLGLTLAVIMANEIEGIEWKTLIDGNREAPVLFYNPTGVIIDPLKLVWSRVKAGETFSITESYQDALASLHA